MLAPRQIAVPVHVEVVAPKPTHQSVCTAPPTACLMQGLVGHSAMMQGPIAPTGGLGHSPVMGAGYGVNGDLGQQLTEKQDLCQTLLSALRAPQDLALQHPVAQNLGRPPAHAPSAFSHRRCVSAPQQATTVSHGEFPRTDTTGMFGYEQDEVVLHLYYPRKCEVDDKGQHIAGTGEEQSALTKLFKQAVAYLHIGLCVFGVEYTFNMPRGMNTRRLGPIFSGCWVHIPREGGEGNVFSQHLPMGKTKCSPQEVERIARDLGLRDFQSCTYDLYHHNCGDFASAMCEKLCVEAPPLWCRYSALVLRNLGFSNGTASPPKEFRELPDPNPMNFSTNRGPRTSPAVLPVAQPMQPQLAGTGSVVAPSAVWYPAPAMPSTTSSTSCFQAIPRPPSPPILAAAATRPPSPPTIAWPANRAVSLDGLGQSNTPPSLLGPVHRDGSPHGKGLKGTAAQDTRLVLGLPGSLQRGVSLH